MVGRAEGTVHVGGGAGDAVLQEFGLGGVDVPLFDHGAPQQVGREHGVVKAAALTVEDVGGAGRGAGHQQAGGAQQVHRVFLEVGVVVAHAQHGAGAGGPHRAVEELHQRGGLGGAARVGRALAVALVGVGAAAGGLALEVVHDERERVGHGREAGGEKLGQRRPLKHARDGGQQRRAPQRQHRRLVEDGAANKVGVVGLLGGAVVHQRVGARAQGQVQARYQVLQGRGGAGAVVLNLNQAHRVGVQLDEGGEDFAALAGEVGRRAGPAGRRKPAARAVAVEVVQHVKAGHAHIDGSEDGHRGPHGAHHGRVGAGQGLHAPPAAAVAQNAAQAGHRAAHAHRQQGRVEVGRGGGVGGGAAVVEQQRAVGVGGLVGRHGGHVAGARAAGAAGGVVVGVDELRGLVHQAPRRNRQLAARAQRVQVGHRHRRRKLHPHPLKRLGRGHGERGVRQARKRRQGLPRTQHRNGRTREHGLVERRRGSNFLHHAADAHPVADGHGGRGLHHK